MKTSSVPSGDHCGYLPKPETLRSRPPVEDTTYRPPPPRSERNTISFPAGDQSGSQSCAGSVVSGAGWPSPTGFIQVSKLPAWLEAYAMKSLLGEKVGCICQPGSN